MQHLTPMSLAILYFFLGGQLDTRIATVLLVVGLQTRPT